MEPSGPGPGPLPDMKYDLPARPSKVVQPLPHSSDDGAGAQQAIELIRQKLNQIYAQEPNVQEERQEADASTHRSKHQQYMHELSVSGRSLAEIQTAWHSYYASLPDDEKHDVWREFYANHHTTRSHPVITPTTPAAQPEPIQPPKPTTKQDLAKAIETVPESVLQPSAQPYKARKRRRSDPRTVTELKKQLLDNVSKRATKRSRTHAHIQSLVFGIASGLLVVTILLFSFFNERFIAPFMTPSRAISNTPIIIDPNSASTGPESKIIIPKINVDIPVVYDEPSIKEAAVQVALERGVVHYATTPLPGQLGNGVIFGHSANNILNKGQYKFAFVLLRKLEPGDLFYLQKNSKLYVYKVYEKKVVTPSEVSVLNAKEKPATFTLITCDPPGTNINRLVIVGEQISPDPSTDAKGTVNQNEANKPIELPSNSPSLWSRIWN